MWKQKFLLSFFFVFVCSLAVTSHSFHLVRSNQSLIGRYQKTPNSRSYISIHITTHVLCLLSLWPSFLSFIPSLKLVFYLSLVPLFQLCLIFKWFLDLTLFHKLIHGSGLVSSGTDRADQKEFDSFTDETHYDYLYSPLQTISCSKNSDCQIYKLLTTRSEREMKHYAFLQLDPLCF